MNRRDFLGTLTILSAPVSAPVMAAPASLTSEESDMIAHMASHNVDSFLMMNKQRGMLLVIERGNLTEMFSALTGINAGDTRAPHRTAAGIFPLIPSSVLSHYRAPIIFDGRNVIHRLADIPGQQRMKRITSMVPDFKRITDGCINVTSPDFEAISNFVLSHPRIKSDTTNPPSAYLAVLPETQTVKQFFGTAPK